MRSLVPLPRRAFAFARRPSFLPQGFGFAVTAGSAACRFGLSRFGSAAVAVICCAPPSGLGCLFGPDVSAAFLANNSFDLIVRSHECVEGGVRKDHNGKVPAARFSMAERVPKPSECGIGLAAAHKGINSLCGPFEIAGNAKESKPQKHSSRKRCSAPLYAERRGAES